VSIPTANFVMEFIVLFPRFELRRSCHVGQQIRATSIILAKHRECNSSGCPGSQMASVANPFARFGFGLRLCHRGRAISVSGCFQQCLPLPNASRKSLKIQVVPTFESYSAHHSHLPFSGSTMSRVSVNVHRCPFVSPRVLISSRRAPLFHRLTVTISTASGPSRSTPARK
jgi:hypothetical protein